MTETTRAAAWYTPTIDRRSRPALLPSDVPWRQGLLVRSTNWLGDVLMTLPAVYRLRTIVPPGHQLQILAPRKLAALWQSVPWVDQVLVFAGKRLDEAERAAVAAAAPGVTVVLPNSFGAAWDLRRAGLPHLLGRTGRGRALLLTHRLPAWRRRPGHDRYHQVSEYLDLAAACGAKTEDLTYPPLAPRLSPADAAPLPAWTRGAGPLLIIAPGAAYGPAKQWPVESFRTVARWWSSQTAGRVIAIGAPGEEAAATAAVVDCPGAVSLAGQTTLPQLMALLQAARCVVANDSGTMHLAAALGRPGVALFGSTDPIATGPLGGRWLVLRHPLPCSPCLARTCHRNDQPYECLHRLPPDLVTAALATHLREDAP